MRWPVKALRQSGRGVSGGRRYLRLGEEQCRRQVRPADVRVPEIDTQEIAPGEVDASEIGRDQKRPAKIGRPQIGPSKVGADQVGPRPDSTVGALPGTGAAVGGAGPHEQRTRLVVERVGVDFAHIRRFARCEPTN